MVQPKALVDHCD